MIDIVILVLLAAGFFIGLKRGLILQVMRLAGYVIAYLVAYLYYEEAAPVLHRMIPYPLGGMQTPEWLKAEHVEEAFYRVLAFILLFLAAKFAWSLLGHLLNTVAQIPVLKQINSLGGGVLGLVEVYIVLFVLIIIGSLIPVQNVQATLQQSSLCKVIVDDTPILSAKVKELWTQHNGV
ncbi:CvpA family protein [Ectobacillus ponti]|uniref:CvpA family protein n=1 Tax=Ectobacillus ponti TaxID=2961894 RepID=A0AA42BPB7_9BACI|nr:CvpA family protein [Ectobacillus ponti]MCP8967389.1 CvpA family protein [Ectobacillus ponti]